VQLSGHHDQPIGINQGLVSGAGPSDQQKKSTPRNCVPGFGNFNNASVTAQEGEDKVVRIQQEAK